MSLLMLVFSVSPILAPLSGSLLIEWWGWRSVFWAVTVAAVLALILLATSQAETRPREQRVDSSVRSALNAYALLLREPHFLGLVFIGAFGISSFFAYLANSSFILIDHYGLTPRQYSIAFAANAASFIGVSQFTGRLSARFGLVPVVKVAVTAYALVMTALLAINLLGIERLDVMLVMLFVGFGFLGLVIPTTTVLALEEHGTIAGTASALMGTLQFVTGAAVMAITGLFVDGTARPMVAGIAACALLALFIAWLTLRSSRMRGAQL
jgi:DHA1 family bicyclomycin/chloramphenicol resistance-like MFS transporter